MGFHYKFNASGLYRWGKCPVYKALEPLVPELAPTEASQKGTATHFVGEWALTHGYGNQVDSRLVGCYVRINNDGDAVSIVTGPNNAGGNGFAGIEYVNEPHVTNPLYPVVIEITQEMVDAVAVYTKAVMAIMAKYPGAQLHTEVQLELDGDMGGMADCVIVTDERIIVIDYKNGRWFVDVEANPQLAMYAVGALLKFDPNELVKDVVMAVVQPNSSGKPVRTWVQTREQIDEWLTTIHNAKQGVLEIESLAKQGYDLNPYCVMGDHCRFCPVMAICPAKQSQTLDLAQKYVPELNEAKPLPVPSSLSEDRLLWVANNGDSIIEFINQCREHMKATAINGKVWPGFKLVEKSTRRRLVNVETLSKELKDNDCMDAFDVKLKPLGALEKLYGKEMLAPYVEKPVGELELVRDTDKRLAHNQSILALMPAL